MATPTRGWVGTPYESDFEGTEAAAATANVKRRFIYDAANGTWQEKVGVDIEEVTFSGDLDVTKQAALTNRSGTIAVGGTAQQAMAVNADRRYLFIQNVSAGDLWFNFTTAAVANQPSVKLPPDASYEMAGTFVSTEAISIIGATNGQAYTAKEG